MQDHTLRLLRCHQRHSAEMACGEGFGAVALSCRPLSSFFGCSGLEPPLPMIVILALDE